MFLIQENWEVEMKKSYITVRGLEDEVIVKLARLAREAKLSREAFIRQLLTRTAETKGMMEQRFLYEELVQSCLKVIEENTVITQLLIEEVKELKHGKLTN